MFEIYFEHEELDLIERIQANLGMRFLDVSTETVDLDGDHSREFIVIRTHSETLKREVEQFRDMERDIGFYTNTHSLCVSPA